MGSTPDKNRGYADKDLPPSMKRCGNRIGIFLNSKNIQMYMFKQKLIIFILLLNCIRLSAQDSLYIVKDNHLTNIVTTASVDSGLFARPILATVNAYVDGSTATVINKKLQQLTTNRTYIQTLKLFGKFDINEPILLDNYTRLDLSSAYLLRSAEFKGAMIKNADNENGNLHIQIIGGRIDGNKDKYGDGEAHGILLVRVSHSNIEGVEVSDCGGDGIRISGNGVRTRFSILSNITVLGNNASGLNIMWASRQVVVTNVIAAGNGVFGIRSDHSECSYTNIVSDRNKGTGIFIRNIFGGTYTNLTATRNGGIGILVQGMVQSSGSNWNAHNNSTIHPGKFSDIVFSADASLSYGISANTNITGIVAGYYNGYSNDVTAKHALEVENPAYGQKYSGLHLNLVNTSPTLKEMISTPKKFKLYK